VQRSRMRRLRARFATVASGRHSSRRLRKLVCGSPSGPTTWLCLQWLDADRMKAGESQPDRGACRAGPVPEARSPRPKSPLWSAVRRCASLFAEGGETIPTAPFGAPSPSLLEGANEAGLARALKGHNDSSPRAVARERGRMFHGRCFKETFPKDLAV
jgi:hypothetical protein